MKESIVGGKAFYYALRIIHLSRELDNKREFVISNQLLRCSTSIGANIEEATAASSRKDFACKMAIASKEARESRYWLRLIFESKLVNRDDYPELLAEVEEIIKMLTKIVKTTQTEPNK
jgi:four helix bundle protein